MLIQNMPNFMMNMSLLAEVPAIPSAVWGTCILEESSDVTSRECHDWKERVRQSRIAGKGLGLCKPGQQLHPVGLPIQSGELKHLHTLPHCPCPTLARG